MPALTTEEVLIEETKAIHGVDLSGQTGTALYSSLNAQNSAALCLSGGGIRSAAFALGVIQSLASHPRPARGQHVAQAENSLLSKFHYLSTVSGGGYIGGWLTAWVTRAGFPFVWRNLVGRPDGFEIEPQAVAWLRSYSNFLTPKLGVFSTDAWADIAVILRNVTLNWFVILPVLCAGLLIVKLYGFLIAWLSRFSPTECGPPMNRIAFAGAAALFIALWFTHSHRPAHSDRAATQWQVLFGNLLPAALAGMLFSLALALPCAHDTLYDVPWFSWSMSSKLFASLAGGAAIYALAWLIALPWWRIWQPLWTASSAQGQRQRALAALPDARAWQDIGRDALGVVVAGGVFGILMGLGVHFYFAFLWDTGIWKFARSEILLVLLSVPWTLASLLLAEILFVGLTNREKNSDADREWLAREAAFYIATLLAWLLVVFLVFLAATVAKDLYDQVWPWLTGVGSGGLAAWLGKSSATPAKGPAKDVKGLTANIVVAVAAAVFGILLVVMTSAVLGRALLGGNLIDTADFRGRVVESGYPAWPGGWQLPMGLAIAVALALIASFCVNINRFSLHALYRNRLIRAFLGASHAEQRKADPFTDFDDADNLRMHELWPPEEVRAQVRRSGWQPFHIVNIALNIVSTKRLAWQERKAEAFTVSALHSGTACGQRVPGPRSMFVARGAYRSSDEYGGPEGISLGTAVAISGAAASPNMGYHSSPPLAFLMTLFNLRLGWWLGNPDKDKLRIYGSEGPNWAIVPLIRELLGKTKKAMCIFRTAAISKISVFTKWCVDAAG